MNFEANNIGTRSVYIRNSIGKKFAEIQIPVNGSYNASLSITATVKASANDILQVYVAQTSGTSLNVSDGGNGLHVYKARG